MVFASVIVPVGDDSLRMEWVLAGLACQTTSSFEVVVCSDDGPPELRHLASRYRDRLDLVWTHLPGPKSDSRSGAARNHAVRASRGELLIFLDGDMVPDPDFVDAHVAHYGPDIAVFGYRRHFPMHMVQPLATRAPDYATLRLFSSPDPRLFGYAGWTKPLFYLHFLSCNYSVPAERFCALGGHDERCVGWGSEDIDLGYRLSRSGCRILPLWGIGNCTHLDHPPRAPTTVTQYWVCNPQEPLCRNGGPLHRTAKADGAAVTRSVGC